MTLNRPEPELSVEEQEQTAAYLPEPDMEPTILYGVRDGASVNSDENENNTNGLEDPHTKRELRGAAVAGGLAGLAVGGPLVGVLAAGGAALVVTTQGPAGKVARAGGEAMASVGDRLKKLDNKHHVMRKTSNSIVKGCKWVSKKVKPKDSTANVGAAP